MLNLVYRGFFDGLCTRTSPRMRPEGRSSSQMDRRNSKDVARCHLEGVWILVSPAMLKTTLVLGVSVRKRSFLIGSFDCGPRSRSRDTYMYQFLDAFHPLNAVRAVQDPTAKLAVPHSYPLT